MTAVITGGGTGIGLACARRLVDDGHEVVLVGRREDVLKGAVAELGSRAAYVRADASDPDDVARLADSLERVDVLVCAAGGTVPDSGPGLAGEATHWLRSFQANVVSAVLVTEALLPLIPRPDGRIVAISSVSGRKGAGAYGAAKAALNNWVVDLAGQLAECGITVNAVAPGFVPDTGFWDGRRDDAEMTRRVAKVAMGRPGQLEEVAEAVAYFASARSGFTTGQILGVDGGTVLSL